MAADGASTSNFVDETSEAMGWLVAGGVPDSWLLHEQMLWPEKRAALAAKVPRSRAGERWRRRAVDGRRSPTILLMKGWGEGSVGRWLEEVEVRRG